jgi:hypothetical protein
MRGEIRITIRITIETWTRRRKRRKQSFSVASVSFCSIPSLALLRPEVRSRPKEARFCFKRFSPGFKISISQTERSIPSQVQFPPSFVVNFVEGRFSNSSKEVHEKVCDDVINFIAPHFSIGEPTKFTTKFAAKAPIKSNARLYCPAASNPGVLARHSFPHKAWHKPAP